MSSLEGEVEHEVEGRRAALGRQLGRAGCRPASWWMPVSSTLDLRPAVAPRLERRRAGPVAPRRHRGRASARSLAGSGEHLLPLVDLAERDRVGQARSASRSAGRRSAGRPRRAARAPRSTVRSAAPGLSARATSAVQVTGMPLRTASSENWSSQQPGPDRHLARRPCRARRAPTRSRTTSSTSANRLGTGRPNAPWWAGWRDVENPMAPASIASRTRPLHRVDLVGGRPAAPRRRARTAAASSGRRTRRR